MLKLIPLMTWTGASLGVVAGVFVPLMTDTMVANPETAGWNEEKQNKYCLLCMVGCGLGEIVGAILLGKIQDKFGDVKATYSCLLLTLIGGAIALGFTVNYSFSMVFAVLMTFSWGVQDGAVNCLMNCILGFQFESKTTPFSVFKSVQSFLIFVCLCIESLLVDKEYFLIYLSSVLAEATLSYLIVTLTFRFENKETKD